MSKSRIFLVRIDECDECGKKEVFGAYSTLELAQRVVEKLNNSPLAEAVVEELPLDQHVELLDTWWWLILMNEDGSIEEQTRFWNPHHKLSEFFVPNDWIRPVDGYKLRATVQAETEAKAIELVNKLRLNHLANGTWKRPIPSGADAKYLGLLKEND